VPANGQIRDFTLSSCRGAASETGGSASCASQAVYALWNASRRRGAMRIGSSGAREGKARRRKPASDDTGLRVSEVVAPTVRPRHIAGPTRWPGNRRACNRLQYAVTELLHFAAWVGVRLAPSA